MKFKAYLSENIARKVLVVPQKCAVSGSIVNQSTQTAIVSIDGATIPLPPSRVLNLKFIRTSSISSTVPVFMSLVAYELEEGDNPLPSFFIL